jgi:hypothetical protein
MSSLGPKLILLSAVAVLALLPAVTAIPQSATVSPKLGYTPVCAISTASPNCMTDPAGFVAIQSGASMLTVTTSAVTATSQIFVQFDASLGTALGGVTCVSSPSGGYWVASRTSGSGFTVQRTGTTGLGCMSFLIVN